MERASSLPPSSIPPTSSPPGALSDLADEAEEEHGMLGDEDGILEDADDDEGEDLFGDSMEKYVPILTAATTAPMPSWTCMRRTA